MSEGAHADTGKVRMGDARDAFRESLRALVGEVDSWGEYREDTSPDERVAVLWEAAKAARAALATLESVGGEARPRELMDFHRANEAAVMLWSLVGPL